MNPDDYQKVKEIFSSVLEIEPAGRSAFLDGECGGDEVIRREVERLLDSYKSKYLEQGAVANVAAEVVGDGLKSGEKIDHYTIVSKIGSGGMGEVYLANDGKLGRQVAIKLLPEAFTKDDDRLRRFQQEARTASALNHPNILTIHEIGETDSTKYIATEYIDGETLRQKLNRERLAVADAMEIAVQTASALAAAHEAGIIHRDIKPENIMLRRDNLVKVLDFGLAKLSEQKGSPPARGGVAAASADGVVGAADGFSANAEDATIRIIKTVPGMIMGTVQYMSPEQTRGHATDARTDIWSLGVVVYEMLAGKPPFAGENSADLIAEIVKTHPAPLSHLDADIPERLDEVVAKTLEKKPDERYQTAKDLLIDLKRLKRKLDLETEMERSHSSATHSGSAANAIETVSDINSSATQTVSSAEYVFSEIKQHKRIATGVSILLLAIVGASAYVAITFWNGSNNPNNARISYANKIKLAAQALDSSNLPLTKQLLDETKPKSGDEDLRGFEWGYLSRLLGERTASQPITLSHEGGVNSVAFSADSKTLATGSNDARLWDVSTGQQTAAFKGHSKSVVSVAISADGAKLATGSFDKSAKLWDIRTGQELWTTIPSTGTGWAIGRLAFSQDGQTLSGEDDDSKIKVWNVSTGTETTPYLKFGKISHPFAVSPDGKLLAAQGPIFFMSVFEIASGRKIASLDSKVGFITNVMFSPDSRSILIAGSDKVAKLWSLPAKKELRTFTGVTGGMAFSPDGRMIAICSKDTIKLLDVEKGYEIANLRGHVNDVMSIAFSPDGLKLASGGFDNTAKIWNVPKNESRGILRAHAKGIGSLTFSPDGKTIVSASDDKTAKLWDVETEQERLAISSHTEKVIRTAFSPDGRTLATAGEDRKIKLSDVVSGREQKSIDSPKPATVLTFSPDGKLLAAGHWFADDREVRLWDTASGTQVCSADARGSGAWAVEFSKDGKQFITATPADDEPLEGNAIRFWETASCREISAIYGEPATGFVVGFVEGTLRAIQVLNNGRSLKLLDIESRKELASFSGHESELRSLAFSPNGKRLFTSDLEGQIKIWDVATGQELLSLKVNAGEAGNLAFSPNGNVLAAAGDSGIIRLWRGTDN